MIVRAVICIALMAAGAVAQPVTVHRWTDARPLTGELVELGLQGVQLRPGDAVMPETVPWFQVRRIEGVASNRDALALDAWRAHTRLRRGDQAGALGIYKRLGEDYLWRIGPQSQDVCLGLTRCLLGAGDRVEAVASTLAWFVAAEVHGPRAEAAPVDGISTQYGLFIDLPPVFSGSDRAVVLDPLPASEALTARERFLHAGFAAVLSGGGEDLARFDQIKREPGVRDPGIELFEDMVHAQAHPDPSRRRAARGALDRRSRTGHGSWIEVWARIGLGAAMLSDTDPQVNERGLIELIHVIVRLPRVRPALTMLAADTAREYLNATDRPRWGAELMLEARSGISGLHDAQEHPAHE